MAKAVKPELTDKQIQAIEAYKEHGSMRKAAKAIGLAYSSFHERIQSAREKGAHIPAPTRSPANGFVFSTSTLEGPAGEMKLQWIKEKYAEEKQAIEDFIDDMCKRVERKGKLPKRRPRKTDTDELLFELDIYDPHIGMFADERETLGSNYNCKIASQRMLDAVWDLCTRAELHRPDKVVIVFGGDLLHSDFRNNKTEQSKNDLDVDSRYDRVQDYAIEICTSAIQIAATVARHVEVVVVEGNHDWHSCKWMARVLRSHYSVCDNITVHVQRSELKYMAWGDNLLCWAHGDKIKPSDWQGIVSTALSTQWGQTRWRYLRLGHIHHQKKFYPIQIAEQKGLVVEYLPALCPPDAWHASAGYIGSQKGASGFIYHKTAGARDRLYYNAE